MQHLQILVQIRLIAERVGGAPEVSERRSKRDTVFFTMNVFPLGWSHRTMLAAPAVSMTNELKIRLQRRQRLAVSSFVNGIFLLLCLV